MNDEERVNALEVALNNEIREREFYLKHAEKTVNPAGKAMFNRIADDETEHYQRLSELHEKWKRNERWPDSIPLIISNTNVKDVLISTIKKLEKLDIADESDLQAIKTAIDFEERGVEFYRGLRDACDNPKEKAFFDLLSTVEYEHFLSLKNAEEYLTSPDTWYIRTEHHMMDGG